MPALLSDTYREVCLWQEQAPARHLPTGDLPASADVVVVGAGYCGLSAAISASVADVLVLDAEPLGWGSSTRNGGMVIPELKAGPDALAKKIGPLAYRLYAELEEAFEHLETVALDCDYRRTGQLYLAHSPSNVKHLRELADDLGVRFLGADEVAEAVGSRVFAAGLQDERVGALHPAKFHNHLVEQALAAGVRIADRTAVTGVRSDPGGFTVSTTRGTVRAGQVIIATNAYADDAVPRLAAQVLPINSYIIATRPLPTEIRSAIPEQMMVDSANLLNYWRLTPDGRMAFGGRRSLDPAPLNEVRDYLYDRMVQVHPVLAGVEVDYVWTGYVAMTVDRLPHVGTIDGAWFATGCNGSGVCLNTWLGHRLGQVVTGQAPPPAFAELTQPRIPLKSLSPMYLPAVGRYFAWQDRR